MTADDFPQLRRLARLFTIMAGIGLLFLVEELSCASTQRLLSCPLYAPYWL